jgi:sterol 24-C-methyltransferase
MKLIASFDQFSKADATTKYAVYGATGVTAVVAIGIANKAFGSDPLGRTLDLLKKFAVQEKKRNINVDQIIEKYNELHNDEKSGVTGRNTGYQTLVSAYYELATLFYEWGWSTSFHFAYFFKGETFQMAIQRHEYYLAGRLGVSAGEKVLDCGCGIGGPMRNIARFTNASITGVTLSEYQVVRGNELNAAQNLLPHRALSVQADFLHLPFENNSFDGVYAIEATCHAPRRQDVYGEIFRVLKPGRVFACYEWCLTPLYDQNNETHRLIKKKIEEGDGLPDMATEEEVRNALADVGFELIEARDMALDERFGGDPWYLPLYPSNNPFSFRFQLSPAGMAITRNALWLMEKIGLAPAGTTKVQTMLQQGGWGCAQGGHTGTFTPMYLMVARKPLNA